MDGRCTNPSPLNEDWGELKVGDLINHDDRSWKYEMIVELFDQASTRAIL